MASGRNPFRVTHHSNRAPFRTPAHHNRVRISDVDNELQHFMDLQLGAKDELNQLKNNAADAKEERIELELSYLDARRKHIKSKKKVTGQNKYVQHITKIVTAKKREISALDRINKRRHQNQKDRCAVVEYRNRAREMQGQLHNISVNRVTGDRHRREAVLVKKEEDQDDDNFGHRRSGPTHIKEEEDYDEY